MPFVRSLNTTVPQPLAEVGRTQASSVSALVRSSDFDSGIVTRLDVPLNESAEPNLPAAVQVAPSSVPLFPLPEASPAEVPPFSSNEYAATRPPVGGGGATVAWACGEGGPRLPAASSARTT